MGKAIERKECMECKRPVKCCDGGSIDMTISEAARILIYLKKSTYNFDDYFIIKTTYKGIFDGLYAKRKVIGNSKEKGFEGCEIKSCVFFDPKKRLCEIHEVKPSLCATHICCDIYHKWTDAQYKELQALRKERGLSDGSSIRWKSQEIINDQIIKKCLDTQRETTLKEHTEIINKFKDFRDNIEEALNMERDFG